MNISFEQNGFGWYVRNDVKYIRVSEPLSIVTHKMLKNWFINNSKRKIEKIKEETADTGTRIHEAISNDLRGQQPEIIIGIEKPFEQWLKVKQQYNIIADDSEKFLVSDLYGYGGKRDIKGLFNGTPCIMDIKTGRYDVKAGWQMAAYRQLELEETGQNCGMVGISIPRDGSEGRVFVYEHIDFCFTRFLSCLEAWKGLYFTELNKIGYKWLKQDSYKIFLNQ